MVHKIICNHTASPLGPWEATLIIHATRQLQQQWIGLTINEVQFWERIKRSS